MNGHEHHVTTAPAGTEGFWDRLVEIPGDFWAVLSTMSPYLLFGFFVAGLLSVLISQRLVERHLGGRGLWPVVKAAMLGVPLPLCSCGVIPVSAGLRRHGASRGATTSFLISTPQTGVDSILVTYSLLGGVFAIFRPLFALVSGIVGGLLVSIFGPGPTGSPAAETAGQDHDEDKPICTDACCLPTRAGKIRRIFAYGFVDLPADIGKSLLIGLVIAALISAVLPPGTFARWLEPLTASLGPLGVELVTIFAMMLAGVPIYVCATASIPIAAVLVIDQGLSPGAAFAFLMTGPATNAATIATVWKVMGRRTTIIYVLTMSVAAIVGGLLLNRIFDAGDFTYEYAGGEFIPLWLQYTSAVVLLSLLVYGMLRPWLGKRHAHELEDKKEAAMKLNVTGMTCSHCVANVRRALLELPGVEAAEVDLDRGLAVVTGKPDFQDIEASLGELGYGVSRIDEPDKETS
jgi:uncharacterized membrane protein YraQ (UPF0718 family)/copper chaperone CopZ